MDVYDLSFFLSTFWVGPFWFAMLVYPHHHLTHKFMDTPWFFIGPIFIWWAIMISNPVSLFEFGVDSLDPTNVLASLAELLATRGGASAAWAHFVAGDIVVTRWMWKRCLDMNVHARTRFLSVFFGVLLMPVGVMLHLILTRKPGRTTSH